MIEKLEKENGLGRMNQHRNVVDKINEIISEVNRQEAFIAGLSGRPIPELITPNTKGLNN